MDTEGGWREGRGREGDGHRGRVGGGKGETQKKRVCKTP